MAIEDDKYYSSAEFDKEVEENRKYENDLKGQYAHKRLDSKEIAEAVDKIARVINHSSPRAVGALLAVHLHKQHRTLQAQTVASIVEMFRLYKGSDYDLRNKAAVEAAGLISDLAKEKIVIPLI